MPEAPAKTTNSAMLITTVLSLVSAAVYGWTRERYAEEILFPLEVGRAGSIGRLVGAAIGAGGLARDPLERLGKVVDVGEAALNRDLAHREAGVLEQVLGALDPQVQQEPVRRPTEAIAEDLGEP